MSVTPRFGLPLLAAGQAQKEISYNEAVQTLEVLVAPGVEEPPLATPPSAPVPGSCYIVAASPGGAWSGKAYCIAAFTSGGWRFVVPTDGLTAYVRARRKPARSIVTVHGTLAAARLPLHRAARLSTLKRGRPLIKSWLRYANMASSHVRKPKRFKRF
jgi:Protein of unknown function (DUF2793)